MSNDGILYPTVQAMPAGTPRDSAIANQNSANISQTELINAVGGKKRRYKKRGGSNIVVPQFPMNYTPTGGPGQNPNDIIKDNASVSSQSAANAEYDNFASIKGGSRGRKRRGGMNPDWIWGCFSGGRRTIKKKTRRGNKGRSKRKTHRRRR